MASTAVLMTGFEFDRRPVRAGRPVGYMPPASGELQPLSIAPLVEKGMTHHLTKDFPVGRNL